MMNSAPILLQKAPIAWADMYPQAAAITTHDGSTEITAYANLYDRTTDLSDEQVEINRYYGIGVLTCSFVQLLHENSHRQRVITAAAQGIFNGSMSEHDPSTYGPYRGIRLADLSDAHIRHAADHLVPYIAQRTDPAKLLLANTFAAAYQRRAVLRGGSHLDRLVVAGLRASEPLAEKGLIRDSLAGSISIFRRLLGTYRVVDAQMLDKVNPVITELIPSVRDADIAGHEKIARQAASLRSDEMTTKLDELVEAAQIGRLSFRKDLLDAEPDNIDRNVTSAITAPLHNARLGCPAIKVEGAIPFVLSLMPSIVERAQIFSTSAIHG